ncbi:MAG: hypothetical protein ACRC0L_06275, partial [Angustibacter sp.]
MLGSSAHTYQVVLREIDGLMAERADERARREALLAPQPGPSSAEITELGTRAAELAGADTDRHRASLTVLTQLATFVERVISAAAAALAEIARGSAEQSARQFQLQVKELNGLMIELQIEGALATNQLDTLKTRDHREIVARRRELLALPEGAPTAIVNQLTDRLFALRGREKLAAHHLAIFGNLRQIIAEQRTAILAMVAGSTEVLRALSARPLAPLLPAPTPRPEPLEADTDSDDFSLSSLPSGEFFPDSPRTPADRSDAVSEGTDPSGATPTNAGSSSSDTSTAAARFGAPIAEGTQRSESNVPFAQDDDFAGFGEGSGLELGPPVTLNPELTQRLAPWAPTQPQYATTRPDRAPLAAVAPAGLPVQVALDQVWFALRSGRGPTAAWEQSAARLDAVRGSLGLPAVPSGPPAQPLNPTDWPAQLRQLGAQLSEPRSRLALFELQDQVQRELAQPVLTDA